MSNVYKISSLQPIQFHQIGVGDFAYNKIPSFEFLKGYNQIYYFEDRPYIQILSPIPNAWMKMSMVNLEGVERWVWWPQYSGSRYGSYYVYEWSSPLPPAYPIAPYLTAGIYFLKLEIQDSTGTIQFYSEPIKLQAPGAEILKIIYTHDQNEFDTLFTDQIIDTVSFLLRIEGGMKSEGLQPGGKFTMFQDQDYNSVMLQSQPYNVEKFVFGPSVGVPNHIADKLNRIFGLSTVTINDIQYSRNEGAKMERNGETEYPLAGWSIDLIKSDSPYSEEFEVNPIIPFTADNTIITADTTLFTADQTFM